MKTIIDKYNKKIIFYGDEDLFFYDLKNFNLKKNIMLQERIYIKLVEILNKDIYIICCPRNIYLISSKYLEIVTIIELNRIYIRFNILYNSKKIYILM